MEKECLDTVLLSLEETVLFKPMTETEGITWWRT